MSCDCHHSETDPCRLNPQLHLFAHVASLPRPLIDASSLLTLLHASFVLPLENEPGLRAERGDELVRVVLETLLRLSPGTGVMQAGNETLESIRTGVQTYMSARQVDRQFLGGESGNAKQWIDVGHCALLKRVAFPTDSLALTRCVICRSPSICCIRPSSPSLARSQPRFPYLTRLSRRSQ